MFNKNGVATNLHGAVGSGVAGLTNPNRALNLSSNTSQGGSGSFAAVTNLIVRIREHHVVRNHDVDEAIGGIAVEHRPAHVSSAGNSTSVPYARHRTNSASACRNGRMPPIFISMSILPRATAAFGSRTCRSIAGYLSRFPMTAPIPRSIEGSDLPASATVVNANATAMAGQTVSLGSAASLSPGGNRLARDRDFAGWIDDFRFYTGSGDSSFVESVSASPAAGPSGLTGVAGQQSGQFELESVVGRDQLQHQTGFGQRRGPYTIISALGNSDGHVLHRPDGGQRNNLLLCSFSGHVDQRSGRATANSPAGGEQRDVWNTASPAPTASYNNPVYAGMTLHLAASRPLQWAAYNWTGPNRFLVRRPARIRPLSIRGRIASGNYSVTATFGGYTSTAGNDGRHRESSGGVHLASSHSRAILFSETGRTACCTVSTTNLSGFVEQCRGRSTASPYTNAPIKTEEFFFRGLKHSDPSIALAGFRLEMRL